MISPCGTIRLTRTTTSATIIPVIERGYAMFRTICLMLLAGFLADASAQVMSGAGAPGGHLREDESRFLPGVYHYRKGCELYTRGRVAAAIGEWKVASGWAMKEAQYNLGLVYFKGEHVERDRPLGLAWLAVAAERKDAEFSESLAAAWRDATPAEHARANELYPALFEEFGDARTRRKAAAHFDQELSHVTGSRVGMPGHVTVWTPRKGRLDVAVYRRDLERLSDINFGSVPEARVAIGEIQAFEE